jgi:hypothetical protein
MEDFSRYNKVANWEFGDAMDNDLLSSFLNTLKEVNATLLELTKLTAYNQLAVRLLGALFAIMTAGFFAWFFSNFHKLL